MSIGFVVGSAPVRWVAFQAFVAFSKRPYCKSARKHARKATKGYPVGFGKGYKKGYYTTYPPSFLKATSRRKAISFFLSGGVIIGII